MKRRRLAAAIATAVLAAAGATHAHQPDESGHGAKIGVPGDPAAPDRAVAVTMSDDMRFSPATIMTRRNGTLKLIIRNAGKIKHEFMLGTRKELEEHAKLMQRFPNMEHDEPNAVSVEPGQTRTLLWKFTTPGTVYFGCLQPGHYEAGMHGKVVVTN